jgi:hypothetical protein
MAMIMSPGRQEASCLCTWPPSKLSFLVTYSTILKVQQTVLLRATSSAVSLFSPTPLAVGCDQNRTFPVLACAE